MPGKTRSGKRLRVLALPIGEYFFHHTQRESMVPIKFSSALNRAGITSILIV